MSITETLESLSDNTVRIVIYGKDDADIPVFDRIYMEPPSINQLREIRNVCSRVFEGNA